VVISKFATPLLQICK